MLRAATSARRASPIPLLLVLAGCSGRGDAGTTAPREPVPESPRPPQPPQPEPPRLPRLGPAQASPVRIAVDGATVVAAIELASPRFMVHEPVLAYLSLSVEGDGAEAQLFSGPSDSLGRPPRFEVGFRGADGRVLPQPFGEEAMNGASGYRRTQPGRPLKQRLRLSAYATSLSPGRYVLQVQTTARARAGRTDEPRDVPISVELPVEVVADDAAAMGAAIDAIGARALGSDYDDARDATFQLEHVADPRALAWWIRLAEVPEYERRFYALRALGTYDDASAIAALVRATQTRPEALPASGYTTGALRAESAGQLRLSAVQALSASARPEALAALLALQASPDREIRLTVLHRLSRLPAVEARPHLERFARDPDATIAGEARRYLAELAR